MIYHRSVIQLNLKSESCSLIVLILILFFKDQVRQARAVFLRDEVGDQWKDTAVVILSHIQQKV